MTRSCVEMHDHIINVTKVSGPQSLSARYPALFPAEFHIKVKLSARYPALFPAEFHIKVGIWHTMTGDQKLLLHWYCDHPFQYLILSLMSDSCHFAFLLCFYYYKIKICQKCFGIKQSVYGCGSLPRGIVDVPRVLSCQRSRNVKWAVKPAKFLTGVLNATHFCHLGWRYFDYPVGVGGVILNCPANQPSQASQNKTENHHTPGQRNYMKQVIKDPGTKKLKELKPLSKGKRPNSVTDKNHRKSILITKCIASSHCKILKLLLPKCISRSKMQQPFVTKCIVITGCHRTHFIMQVMSTSCPIGLSQ